MTAPTTGARLCVPGVLLAAVCGSLALTLSRALSPYLVLSPLILALLVGVAVANTGARTPAMAPGLDFSAKRLLRAGIVLLGLELAFPLVLGLGPGVLVMVLVTMTLTFGGTLALGRWMGLSLPQTLLIATGVSVCGVSAIAAVESVAQAKREEVTVAVSVISLYGTAVVFALPLLADPLGLNAGAFGVWAGASVHEVAQVVAAAGTVGGALAPAVVVKLTRVVMLAPLVTALSLWRRRQAGAGPDGSRPPLVPLFVLGFLAAMTLRSTGVVPDRLLDPIHQVQVWLLTMAMFALGTSIRIRTLYETGLRGLALGLWSSLLISVVTLVGVVLAT